MEISKIFSNYKTIHKISDVITIYTIKKAGTDRNLKIIHNDDKLKAYFEQLNILSCHGKWELWLKHKIYQHK